jgi:hypothetical protein
MSAPPRRPESRPRRVSPLPESSELISLTLSRNFVSSSSPSQAERWVSVIIPHSPAPAPPDDAGLRRIEMLRSLLALLMIPLAAPAFERVKELALSLGL